MPNAVPMKLGKLFVRRLANAQIRRAVSLAVNILGDEGRAAAILFTQLEERATLPTAMIAAPFHTVLVDGDAERF